MKKFVQKITTFVMIFMMGVGMVAPAIQTTPVYADDGTPCTCSGGASGKMTEGAIFKYCECGGGESIKAVVLFVADILSVLIGIVGVIGIVIVGIQYLTAGGNEEQTRKAKRRLFEIVIGIMAYVLIYALLKWLLPNFDSSKSSLETTIASLAPFIGV